MRSGAISASSSNSLLISETGVDIFASGDLDDYFTFSVTSDRPLFSATGNYLVLGKDATTGHSLDADDVLFGEDVEIDGILYMDGDISIGANKLKTTNLAFLEESSSVMKLRNTADDAAKSLRVAAIYATQLIFTVDSKLSARNADSDTIEGQARDNTVGLVDIWSMVGADDPYFQIGRDDTGVSINTVTDGLVLQMGAGSNNEAANSGFGISVLLGNDASQVEERASIDFVLTTATDGSEAAKIVWGLMSGGAAVAEKMSLTDAGLLTLTGGLNLGGDITLFDSYRALKHSVDDSRLGFSGGTDQFSGRINVYGKNESSKPGQIRFFTPDAAKTSAITRLVFGGVSDITTAVWSDITHTGIVLSGALDAGGQDITGLDSLFIDEKASADGDVSGDGQLWVKSDTPNVPYFTDDAGKDTPLIGNVHPLVNTYISGTGTAGTDNTAETVKTVVVPANTLTQVGDRLRVRVYFRGDTGGGITMTNTVNTVTVAAATDGGGTDWFMTETWLHYIGVNNANIAEMGATPATGSNTAANVGGFDWSAAQDVDCDQNQVSANHIVVYAIFLDVYPKGVI